MSRGVEPLVVVHGGAGDHSRAQIGMARVAAGLATVETSLRRAVAVLETGGTAVDAVVAAVAALEDGEELNTARGAALTKAGRIELCASVADGARRRAGGLAVVTVPRHPVELARRVLESQEVMLAGPGADEFAIGEGLGLEPMSYFVTERQCRALAEAVMSSDTVGAVARDRDGHLAAATSTGGTTGKRPGQVGDSPVYGAGVWADDTTCAVSATGDGEVLLRAVFAHDVHARVTYCGVDLSEACRDAVAQVADLGGTGGCIALGQTGPPVMVFNITAMYRGWGTPGGEPRTGVEPGECETR
jgi:beta-aspartyl-peptidase (threonine type)